MTDHASELQQLNEMLAEDGIDCVRVERRAGQGRILVSTRNLSAGTILFRAPSIVLSKVQHRHELWLKLQKELALMRAQGFEDDFTDEDIWGALHTLVADEVPSTFSLPTVSAKVQGLVQFLHSDGGAPSIHIEHLCTAFGLRCTPQKFQQLLEIWDLNSFTHTQCKKTSALALAPSLMNHSCIPNVNWYFEGDTVVCRANRDIAALEECFECYIMDDQMLLPTEQRRQYILDTGKGFICRCTRCAHPEERCRNVRCPACLKSGILNASIPLGTGDAHCSMCGKSMSPEQLTELIAVERRIWRLLRRLDTNMVEGGDEDEHTCSRAEAADRRLSKDKALDTLQNLIEERLAPERHWMSFRAAGMLSHRALNHRNLQLALQFLQRRVSFVRRAFEYPSVPTPPSPVLGWELEEMACIELRRRRPAAAADLLRQSLQVLLPMFGPEDETNVEIQKRLQRLSKRCTQDKRGIDSTESGVRPKVRRLYKKTSCSTTNL